MIKSYIKLCEAIHSKMNHRFFYGVHDCCTFSGNCISAMVNKKDFFDCIDSYRGLEEADAIINKFGGMTGLINHVCTANGMTQVFDEPTWGDVVVFREDPTSGVVFNHEIHTARDERGVASYPIENIHATWRYV